MSAKRSKSLSGLMESLLVLEYIQRGMPSIESRKPGLKTGTSFLAALKRMESPSSSLRPISLSRPWIGTSTLLSSGMPSRMPPTYLSSSEKASPSMKMS